MDRETMKAMGKVLGEIYRLQRRTDPQMCGVNDATIYGLLHGFEHVLLDELNIRREDGSVPGVSQAEFSSVANVLEAYWQGKKPMLAGFYEIEHELAQAGVDRAKAIRILTYMKANGQFEEEINAMNSQNSPTECKTFELDTWDK